MKFAPKDHLPIAAALLAIFFSGYGVGYLLGGRAKESQPVQPILTIPDNHQASAWKQKALEDLDRALTLNSYQKKLIAEEIQQTSVTLTNSRINFLQNIQQERKKLIQHILPHLTAEQQKKLKKGSGNLEESMRSTIPAE